METIPKYREIMDYIQEQIQNHVYQQNAKLPTEQELSEQFDVSRPTVVKALDRLRDMGIVYRVQGSGTFGVESVLSSVIGDNEKVLICSNGAYGKRMTQICDRNRIAYTHYQQVYNQVPDAAEVARLLAEDPSITHVAMVHSETTSGILNDIQSVGKIVKEAGRVFIVDAMSSFGGMEIPVKDWGIDFLVSSANKCIQGVPGFSFIICRRDELLASEGKAHSLSLDLLEQWNTMEKDGKWRYTSPTHVVLAFAQALKELEAEGEESRQEINAIQKIIIC